MGTGWYFYLPAVLWVHSSTMTFSCRMLGPPADDAYLWSASG